MLRRLPSGDLVARYGADPARNGSSLRAGFASCLAVTCAFGLVEVAARAPRSTFGSLSLWSTTVAGALGMAALGFVVAALAREGLRRASPVLSERLPPLFVLVPAALASVSALPSNASRGALVACAGIACVGLGLLLWAAEGAGRLGRSAYAPSVAAVALPVLYGAARSGLSDSGGGEGVRAGLVVAALVYAALYAAALWFGRGRHRALVVLVVGSLVALRLSVPNPHEPKILRTTEAAAGTPILFVVLDTVRADVVALEGADAPRFGGISTRGDRYTHAVANASWTLPAHASIFTGLELAEHGTDAALESGLQPKLPAELDTLAERLGRRGYASGCVTANGIVGPATGLSRGFGRYENPAFYWLSETSPLRWARAWAKRSPWDPLQLVATLFGRPTYARASEITDRALASLPESAVPPAHLLFVNYMDAHRPYANSGALRLGERLAFAGDQLRLLYGDLDFGAFRARNTDRLRRLYRAQISQLDREVARLVAAYRDRGWLESTLFVVTSDHGQALWENTTLPGYFGHQGAYEPVVRIPLVIQRPGQRSGALRGGYVQQSDLADWIVAGVDHGFEALAGDDEAITEWYPRSGRAVDLPARRALYAEEHKLVVGEGGAEQLYELAESPFDEIDRLADRPDVAAILRERLVARDARERAVRDISGPGEATGGTLDEAIRSQLEALGYIR